VWATALVVALVVGAALTLWMKSRFAERDALNQLVKNDPLPGQLSWFELDFEPFAFSGERFPAPRFQKPHLVREILGDYNISTRYFDAQFSEVTTAASPGRYGAVATINFKNGPSIERYYTLYRYPGTLRSDDWWLWASRTQTTFSISMPPALGIDRETERTYASDISRFVRFGFYENMISRTYSGRILASLHEAQSNNPPNAELNLVDRDRQWWVTMKRKLHPPRVAQAEPVVVRTPVELSEASVSLRAGAPRDAGMPDNLQGELNEILKQWADETGIGFTAAVSRGGVVLFSGAFGEQDGEPVTEKTRGHLASINKLVTGIAVTMMVDQGLLSLDENISTYLPELREALRDKPITLRNLLFHESGLPDLTLDELHDLEQVLKIFIPQAKVRTQYLQSETGYSLAGKIIERMTGMVISKFFAQYVIQPLGLQDFDIKGAASDAHSNALDLTKLGQLVLNRGSYDKLRLFSAQSFQSMIPASENTSGHGIGLHVMPGAFLDQGAFGGMDKTSSTRRPEILELNRQLGFKNLLGYGTTSGSIFFVDTENNLVVSLVKNRPSPKDADFRKRFVEAIGKGLR
jgi:CubicO group peptidase (beta-lactamase class C family)